MCLSIIILLFLFPWLFASPDPSFREEQLKYPRVKAAYDEKYAALDEELVGIGISDMNMEIFIRILKKEKILEVWVKGSRADTFRLFKQYGICRLSGRPGPKRREGDLQVPEGFYRINHFNPNSNFHLSMGINYPNKSDRIKGHPLSPGGNIYIHGSCATIGCIPVTDDRIKELYVLAVEAKSNGQTKIPIHIFPGRMAGKSYETLREDNAGQDELLDFWKNIKKEYDFFESTNTLPLVKVNANGDYQINQ